MTLFIQHVKVSWMVVLAVVLSLGISQVALSLPQVAHAEEEEATSTPATSAYLSGWKYYDVNYNRQRDGVWPDDEDGEPGVPSWIIHLYKLGEYVPFLTTTAEGDKGIFEFTNVPAGDYLLCEDFGWDEVWYQTDPYEGGGSSWLIGEGDLVQCPNTTWGYQVTNLQDGEERYSFTFGNSKWASVLVNQIAFPNVGDFTFKLVGADYDQERVTAGSNATSSPLSFLKLLPGHYELSQTLAATSTQSVTCTDGEGAVDPTNLNLVSGTQINCTYQNGVDFGDGSTATTTPVVTATSTATSTDSTSNEDDNNNSSSGGRSGSRRTSSSASTTSPTTGGVALLTASAPLALNTIDLTDEEIMVGDDEKLTLATSTIGTTTSTTTDATSSPLIAAIAGLDFGSAWFWLLAAIIILVMGGGYWYWSNKSNTY